jgi:hypothetical protein
MIFEFRADTGTSHCAACTSDGCNGRQTCSIGYESHQRCMTCSAGFYADGTAQAFHCSPCREAPAWAIALLCVGALIIAVVYLKLNSTMWFEYVMTPVRIGFIYVSVVSMLNLVKLQWPGGVLTVLSGMQLSLFKLDVLQGAACFLSFKTTFYLALNLPFALALALLGVLGLSTLMTREHRGGWLQKAWAYIGIRADDHFRRRGRFRIRALLVRTYLSFLSSSYSYLAWSSVQLFVCADIGAGGKRLRAFAEIVCYSSEWYSLFPSALMGLLLYVVGIPVLQLMMLRRFRWGEHADSAAFLGYRVTGYKHGFRWWDSVDIVWRLSVALSIQLLMDNPTAQLTLFTLLIVARLAAQRRFRPFVETLNNLEEHVLQWLTLGVLACGVVFYAFKPKLNDKAQAFFFVLVITFLAFIVLCVARATVLAFRGRRRFDSDGSRGGSHSSSRADSRNIDGCVIDSDEFNEISTSHSRSRAADQDVDAVALQPLTHAYVNDHGTGTAAGAQGIADGRDAGQEIDIDPDPADADDKEGFTAASGSASMRKDAATERSRLQDLTEPLMGRQPADHDQ